MIIFVKQNFESFPLYGQKELEFSEERGKTYFENVSMEVPSCTAAH
jgi:hypothetical protein